MMDGGRGRVGQAARHNGSLRNLISRSHSAGDKERAGQLCFGGGLGQEREEGWRS